MGKITKQNIFDIHRLRNEGKSQDKIAKKLKISVDSVRKYLEDPEQVFKEHRQRASKLDDYYHTIDKYLDEDPDVHGTVILRKLKKEGYTGEIGILRKHLKKARKKVKKQKVYIRFETEPGQQVQIDWGHFGSLKYGKTKRKLYALAAVEGYSRMLYVEFTHSQKQSVLHQCLLNAFKFFGGTPEQIVVDNMLTAVTERQGKVVQFNGAFLDFLRPFKIVPYACNVRSPQEKGKVERAIRYIRQNFWPLRKINNLDDVNSQVKGWLNDVANVRNHETFNERPVDRSKKLQLRKLPEFLPDCREVCDLLVYKDMCVKFDKNSYTAPPWSVGKYLTIKADNKVVSMYYKDKKIATHFRRWESKKRVELPSHIEQVKKIEKRLWQDQEVAYFTKLGQEAVDYINGLSEARQPVRKTVIKLLALKDEYGKESLLIAIRKALKYRAFGLDYINNILYQEMTPIKHHQDVQLKNDELNRIRLEEPCLAEYDKYLLIKEYKK